MVKGVMPNGLIYIDDSGIEKFVDFKKCNENWLQFRKRTECLSNEQFENLKANDKCIGQGDICAKPRFIHFFTKPFTKIEFEDINQEDFIKLKEDIINYGWTMIDLS